MSARHPGDMIEAGPYTVEELRETVFERRGRLERPLALALLARKEYPGKVADLQRVLTDEKESPQLRVIAASALGEIGSTAAVEALEKGLASQEGVTLRSVAKALGKVGSREHLSILNKLAKRPDPVGQEAKRALVILDERVTVSPAGEEPHLTVAIDRTTGVIPIQVRKPAMKEAAAAIKSAPSERLTSKGAVSMECQGRHLIFLFHENSFKQGIGTLESRVEVGIVAEQRQLEGTGWELRYRVAVMPEGKQTFRIFVTTHDGRRVYVGRGQVKNGEATYYIAAEDRPGALAVDIRGRFDGEKLTIEHAESALRRQPARFPTPAQTRQG